MIHSAQSALARRLAGQTAVRVAVAVLLFAAAGLKAHQLATSPTEDRSLLSSRWFLIGVVEVELLISLLLVAGLGQRGTWWLAVAFFAGSAGVSGSKIAAGEPNCGCFGNVAVPPAVSLAVDLVALAGLILWMPPALPSAARGKRGARRIFAASALVLGLSAMLMMARFDPDTLGEDGRVVGDASVVLLDPPRWLDKRWPLLEHVDIGDQLATDQWTVMLYHHDCPKCREAMPRYEALAREQVALGREVRVAGIELPPYAESLLAQGSPIVRGRLSNARRWFVSAPVEVVLRDSRVVRVIVGSDR